MTITTTTTTTNTTTLLSRRSPSGVPRLRRGIRYTHCLRVLPRFTVSHSSSARPCGRVCGGLSCPVRVPSLRRDVPGAVLIQYRGCILSIVVQCIFTSAVEHDVPPERTGLGGSDGRRQRFDRGSRRFRHGPPAAPLRRLQAASRHRRRRLAPGTGQRARCRQRSTAAVCRSREAQIDVHGRGLATAVTVRRALVGDRHPPKTQELCRLYLRIEQERKGTLSSLRIL